MKCPICGDPQRVNPANGRTAKTCGQRSCINTLLRTCGGRRRRSETYSSIHKRLYRDRGPATNHRCVGCGSQAMYWSLSWYHADLSELVTQVGGLGSGSQFSPNLDNYDPRCATCAHNYDVAPADRRAWSVRALAERWSASKS